MLTTADAWYYYRPDIDGNVVFILTIDSSVANKVVIHKLLYNTETFQPVAITQTNEPILGESVWYDIKVVYTSIGDVAYVCSEYNSSNGFISVYDLSNLYTSGTASHVKTINAGSFHNVHVFQNSSVAYLYALGGVRNGLEIYDLCIDPLNPLYVGGYYKIPAGYTHVHSDNTVPPETVYVHDCQVIDSYHYDTNSVHGYTNLKDSNTLTC